MVHAPQQVGALTNLLQCDIIPKSGGIHAGFGYGSIDWTDDCSCLFDEEVVIVPKKRFRPFNMGSREETLLAKYNLTVEAYNALLQRQDNKCKICGKAYYDKRKRAFAVDHEHKTGRIRGLLCVDCNVMLGMAHDDRNVLLKAIQYLKRNLTLDKLPKV